MPKMKNIRTKNRKGEEKCNEIMQDERNKYYQVKIEKHCGEIKHNNARKK